MFPAGFLGTRADILIDVVTLSFIIILPILIVSWRLARTRKDYSSHRTIQLYLGIALGVVVAIFEYDLSTSGGIFELVKGSAYEGTAILNWTIYIHTLFAIAATVIWAGLIIMSLIKFGKPPQPNAFSKNASLLGSRRDGGDDHGGRDFAAVVLLRIHGLIVAEGLQMNDDNKNIETVKGDSAETGQPKHAAAIAPVPADICERIYNGWDGETLPTPPLVDTMQPFEKGDIFTSCTYLNNPHDNHAGVGRIVQYDSRFEYKGVLWIPFTSHLIVHLRFDLEGNLWGCDCQGHHVAIVEPSGKLAPGDEVCRRRPGQPVLPQGRQRADGRLLQRFDAAARNLHPYDSRHRDDR